MGVNSRKLGDTVKTHTDKRVPNYKVDAHFDDVAKLCHSVLADLKHVPKLTQRPKKTSNNLKLEDFGGENQKKYLVLTL